MATTTPIKIQVRCRTKWWQFWLPEHMTIAMDSAPFDTLVKVTRVLQAQVTDLGDMVIVLNDQLDNMRKDEALAQSFADNTVPLQPLPGELIHPQPEEPLHIPIVEVDDDTSDGGDWQPETSTNVVEFDREASAKWSPDQNGSVIVKQPPIINQMRNQARNDMRKLQK